MSAAPLLPSTGLGWAIEVEAPVEGWYVLIRHDAAGPSVEGAPVRLQPGERRTFPMAQAGIPYHVQVSTEEAGQPLRVYESARWERAAHVYFVGFVSTGMLGE